MATIASLIIALGVDPEGVRSGIAKVNDYISRARVPMEQLERSATRAFKAVSTGADQSVPYVRGLAQASTAGGRAMAQMEIEARKLDATLGKAGDTTRKLGGHDLSLIRRELIGLSAQMTGTLPLLDRMLATFVTMGAGGAVTLGVVAGIAAIAFVYRGLTRDARDLAEAQEKALQSLIAIDKERRLGATGKVAEDNTGANAALGRLTREKGIVTGLTSVGGAVGALAQVYDALIGTTNKKFADATEAVRNGNARLGQELTAAFLEDRAKATATLAENISSNNATHAERLRAVRMLREDQALMRQYIKAGVSGDIRSALGSQIETLNTSLNPKSTAAADAVSETQQLITSLDLVNEKYAQQAQTIDTVAAFQAAYNARMKESKPIIDEITEAARKLEKSIASGTLSAQQQARALSEVLKGHKAIDAATNTSALIAGISKTGVGQLADQAFQPANAAALQTAYDQVASALQSMVNDLNAGLIPATQENIGAMNALYTALGVAADRIDRIIPSRAVPLTAREILQGRGRDAFQNGVGNAANAVTQTRAQVGEAFGNIGLGFQRELSNAREHLLRFALSLEPATVVSSTLSAGLGALTSIVSATFAALNPFSSIISAVATAAKPLEPVIATFANIVAQTLAPVFQAFAPVLQALLPLFRALMQVVTPILRALAPLFLAFIPILNALFPVFKLVAIVATYLGQAFALAAQVILNVVGALSVTLGGIIAGMGTFISHIPFLGGIGRDIRDFGNGIKNFGHGALEAANKMGEAVDALGKAREEIEAVNLDPTATAVDNLADAANAATSALLNVPTWYKIALARFNAAAPVPTGQFGGGPQPITPPQLPLGGPLGTPQTPDGALPTGGSGTGGTGGGSGLGGAGAVYFTGPINVDAKDMTPGQFFDMVLSEAQKRARAQLGDKTRWSEVQF